MKLVKLFPSDFTQNFLYTQQQPLTERNQYGKLATQ